MPPVATCRCRGLSALQRDGCPVPGLSTGRTAPGRRATALWRRAFPALRNQGHPRQGIADEGPSSLRQARQAAAARRRVRGTLSRLLGGRRPPFRGTWLQLGHSHRPGWTGGAPFAPSPASFRREEGWCGKGGGRGNSRRRRLTEVHGRTKEEQAGDCAGRGRAAKMWWRWGARKSVASRSPLPRTRSADWAGGHGCGATATADWAEGQWRRRPRPRRLPRPAVVTIPAGRRPLPRAVLGRQRPRPRRVGGHGHGPLRRPG